ncbi:MAG: ATP-binding protein [Pseudomonadota bacterium]
MDLLQSCCNSRELLDKIFSCLPDPIIVTDLDGNILFTTPVVQKVFGYTPEELKNKKLSTFFTPEDLVYLYPNLLYLARKEKPFEGEIMLIDKNEVRFFAFIEFRPCCDPSQDKAIIVICIHTIDKQKQPEKVFREVHYEDLVKIANGIAHELRNPLVSIGGFVNRLYKSCRITTEHDKYYEYITNNLRKIEGLVKKVDFFAALPKPCFADAFIGELIKKAVEAYLQKIEARNIDVTVSMENVALFVDSNLVIRVFTILIENALDALPDGGRILIRSETSNNQCKVYVTDTGCGISPADLPYIFNPFFSTKPSGAGIDLAVVKRIMESHGGEVEVSSKLDEGTTFLLRFPLERRRPIRISSLKD